MDLHKLPKDILIEIVKKTFDFSKLSIEEVERLYGPLHNKFKQKCLDEERKNGKLLKEKFYVGDLYIETRFSRILIGRICQISVDFLECRYDLKYRTLETYSTEEDLINRISEILKVSPINKSDKQIEEIIFTTKMLIKTLQDNEKISDIQYKYFPST